MGAVDEAQVRMLAWIMQTLVRIQCPKGGSLFIYLFYYYVLLLLLLFKDTLLQRNYHVKEQRNICNKFHNFFHNSWIDKFLLVLKKTHHRHFFYLLFIVYHLARYASFCQRIIISLHSISNVNLILQIKQIYIYIYI